MKIKNVLSALYPLKNNTIDLPHPGSGKSYSMLNDTQLLTLAKKSLQILSKTGIKQVIVAESGAVPFAKICCWLTNKMHIDLQWYAIKLPRDLQLNLSPLLKAYYSLSKNELRLNQNFDSNENEFAYHETSQQNLIPENYFNSHCMTLPQILQAINHDVYFPNQQWMRTKNQITGLAKILEKPFIFFDEYIDSGKTLFQTFRFLQLFAKLPRHQLFSYLIKLNKAEFDQTICHSLFTLDNQFAAYEYGAYPFENRIDWLGYYYFYDKHTFEKISIHSLSKFSAENNDDKNKIEVLLNNIGNLSCVHQIKTKCKIPTVAKWINDHHFIRFSLFKLEKITEGRNIISEFLMQLFDMYGPCWSPLPDSYHLDFIDAFESHADYIRSSLIKQNLHQLYQAIRTNFIATLADLFAARSTHQQQSLFHFLEKQHAS